MGLGKMSRIVAQNTFSFLLFLSIVALGIFPISLAMAQDATVTTESATEIPATDTSLPTEIPSPTQTAFPTEIPSATVVPSATASPQPTATDTTIPETVPSIQAMIPEATLELTPEDTPTQSDPATDASATATETTLPSATDVAEAMPIPVEVTAEVEIPNDVENSPIPDVSAVENNTFNGAKPSLLVPADKYATNDSTTTFFDWTDVEGATEYQVQLDNDKNFGSPNSDISVASSTMTRILGLADGIWYWRVRGWNEDTAGAWSTIVRRIIIDKVPPDKTSLKNPSDKAGVSDTTPTLTWNKVSTANLYQIQLAKNIGMSTPIVDTTTSATSFTLPTEQALGRYYWHVRARDAAGNWGAWSTIWSFDLVVMRSPVNESWTTDISPSFLWNKLSGVVAYEIEVATNPNFALANLVVKWADPKATGYTVPKSDVLPYGIYYWRVNIDRGTGSFEQSPLYWVLTISPKPPVAPKLLTPTSKAIINDNTPLFTWESVLDAESYEIQISSSSKFAFITQASVEHDLNFNATSLVDGKYYWRVRSTNELGISGAWSKTWEFSVDIVPLDAPTLKSPTNLSSTNDTTPSFQWLTDKDAKRYEMQLATISPPNWLVYDANKTSYVPLSGLLRNRWYYWRVRAFDAAGNVSGWSDIWSVAILSPENDAPVTNRYTNSTPSLSWTRVTWATGYVIEIDDDNRFRSVNYASGIIASSNLSHTLTISLPNGTWYWRIAAIDGSGKAGNWSTMGSFVVEV